METSQRYRDVARQRLRDAIVWQGYDPAKIPADFQWHYNRTLADTARRDEASSLELIEQGGRFCIGDPDDCIRYLELYEAMGMDEIMPLFQVGPVSHQEVMETLRLFGKHVMPHFQGRANRERSCPWPSSQPPPAGRRGLKMAMSCDGGQEKG